MKRIALLLSLLIFLSTYSCQKEEFIKQEKQINADNFARLQKIVDQQFFDYNYISAFNTRLEELEMKEINETGITPDNNLKSGTELYSTFITEIRDFFQEKEGYRKHLENKYGYPMWDQLFEFSLEDGGLAVIPMAKLSSIYTEAIIYVFKKPNDHLKIHVVERGKFNKYPIKTEIINGKRNPDREFVLSQFLLFDKTIFQYEGCDILDEYKELINTEKNLKSATTTICFYDSYVYETPHYSITYVNGEVWLIEYTYTSYEYVTEYYCTSYDTGGNNGGGGSSGSIPQGVKTWTAGDDKPCNGDPVMSPTIAATASGSLLGGTFGWTRYDNNGNSVFHNGLDIAGNIGDPLYATYNGIVDYVQNENIGANGKHVKIISEIGGETFMFIMIHMNDVYVEAGDLVQQGAIIGEIGDTGNAYNVPNKHVHISIRKRNPNGSWPTGLYDYEDPISFLSTSFRSNWSPIPCIGNFE